MLTCSILNNIDFSFLKFYITLLDTIGGTIAKSSKRHLSDDIDVMIVDDIEEPATLQSKLMNYKFILLPT